MAGLFSIALLYTYIYMLTTSCKELRDLKGFRLVHLNCRSLYNKITQIGVLSAGIDVLCLTETWLHNMYSDVMATIEGKKCFRWDRSNGVKNGVEKTRGGGLMCYVDDRIASDCSILKPLCITSPDIELLAVKLAQASHKTRYILTIYRPPCGNVDTFFKTLENVLLENNLNHNEIWLIGDFNINCLKRNDRYTKKAIEFARVHGLCQHIDSPTHLSGFTGSCIDLIFTNANFLHSFGGLDDVISDHFPIFVCVKKPCEVYSYSRVKGRSYTQYDKITFCTLLQADNWAEFFAESNPNILWDILLEKIEAHLGIMCPLKYIKITNNKPFWLSHHIFESLNDRNLLYRKAKSTNDANDLHNARQARNRTNKLINSAKEDFIKDSLNSNLNDPKKFWRIINNSFLKGTKANEPINLLDDEGLSLTLEESCTYMNDYLTSFGVDLKRQFGNVHDTGPHSFSSYDQGTLAYEYEIKTEDIISVLKDIDINKGSGLDYLPSFVIKDAFLSILPQIRYLMNQSLLTGIFPLKWSIATVTPIPKCGDLHKVGNWRPISILPLPGKILEKICSKFLLVELEENDVLSPFQFGFRKELSTSHVIFHYVKHIVDHININKVTASAYLDFARAFDSVNYQILESKLADMGLSYILRKWIKGYLSNRHICTKMNGFVSDTKPLVYGVPQGSVIGPILFLCYINDIVDIAATYNACISLYADDAVVFGTSDNDSNLEMILQPCLNDIVSWCKLNQINLNVSKTKLCCYGRRHTLRKIKISLHLNNKPLNVCHQYNYLGVLLDETMTLESNINVIFKKFSYKIFQFTKIRHYLETSTRILVYKQTILPLVEYVSFMLLLNRNLETSKLQKLQNRSLRLCFNINDPRDITVLQLHNAARLLSL